MANNNKLDVNKEYMLTTSKIKQHWMLDPRWTVHDKLKQYQGIIKLYEREQKIIKNDTLLTKEQNIKRIHLLRESIKLKRNQLNQQQSNTTNSKSSLLLLNQTLQDHKQLQLKYQNQDVIKVVDNLKQMNYDKKKTYDQLIFKRKQRTHILNELKLKLNDLENRTHLEYPLEEKAQIISGRITDIKLKANVAKTIQRNFTNILQTMKQDAIYFDSILLSLEKDARSQAKCLYRTTQLGQLATEYLDDRIHDYKRLEHAIQISMEERLKNIKLIKQDVKDTTKCLKHLILIKDNKDKDINLNIESKHNDDLKLNQTIESIESILKFIQSTCYVSEYHEILPRIQDQHQQFNKLFNIVHQFNQLRDQMILKQNHAQLMHDTLITNIADTTYQYMEQKNRDRKLKLKYDKRLKDINNEYYKVAEIYLNIRVSLQFLHQLTQCVNVNQQQQQSGNTSVTPSVPTDHVDHKHKDRSSIVMIDVNQILTILKERYQLLINNYIDLDSQQNLSAVALYQQALMDASNQAHHNDFDEVIDQTSLVSDIELNDPSIPSRDDIKKRSARIVQDCAKKDDDQPIILLPLRGKTY